MFEVAVFWSLDFLCDTCPLPRLKWEEMGGQLMGGEPTPINALQNVGLTTEILKYEYL